MKNNLSKQATKLLYDDALLNFNKKKHRKELYYSKVKISDDTKSFSLLELHEFNKIKDKAIQQTVIRSFDTLFQDKIMIFETATIDPSLNIENITNLTNSITTNKQLVSDCIKNQYQEFKRFNRHFKNYNINAPTVYTYELTSSYNLHNHKIKFIETNELKTYIKSLLLSRNKSNIGRVEIKVDIRNEYLLKELFNDFYIRYGNGKKEKLSLRKFQDTLYIPQSKISAGNMVYFKFIKPEEENDNKYIAKYIFKYLNKSSSYLSKEQVVFSELKIRSVQYSKQFFGFNKSKLFKIVDAVYRLDKKHKILTDRKNPIPEVIEKLKNNTIYTHTQDNTTLTSYFIDINGVSHLLYTPYSNFQRESYLIEHEAVVSAFKDRLKTNHKPFTKLDTIKFDLSIKKVQFLKSLKKKYLEPSDSKQYFFYVFNKYHSIKSLWYSLDIKKQSIKQIDKFYILFKKDFNHHNIYIDNNTRPFSSEELSIKEQQLYEQYPQIQYL